MITSSRSAKLHRRPRRSLGFRSFRMSTKVILIAVIAGVITPVAATSVAVATLLFGSLPGNLPEKKPSLVSYPSYVTDSAGNPIGVFREFDLTIPVQPADVPTVLKNAVVAAEDKRFWQHKGVDAWGLARAAWTNYSEGETVQGGSTITQQYVKNAYLTGERSLSRKLREAVLATQLERRMSKEEILFDYLNTIYFGSGAYGVGAAAVSYFGKSVKDLTLSEAATLAGLIPAPTVWSPRVDSRAAEGRRELVLKEMLDQRLVSQEEYDQAKALGLWLVTDGPPPAPATLVQPQPTKGGSAYPHVVDWVEQVLLAKYGPEKVYRGGLTVQTTLDPKLQSMAQQAVSAHLEGTSPPVDMALVSIEPATGLVKAMVGGRDYNSSQVNLATGGTLGFQPGSSFKPFTLATAFEQGIGPETVYNAPSRLKLPNCDGPDCYINNVEGGGGGRMTLRNATTNSVNTVFAQLIMDLGPQKVAEMANRLGVTAIKPGNDYGVSLTLGAYEVSPLDMATGYATLANGGVRQDATPILKVLDHDGHVLEDNSHRPGVRAVSA
ncbi:MAG: penicillin-binding protein, partial [Acidimicrobiia bacterium]|nr:penicillin-binding protein [Acidimicrobiia bacterium]